VFEAGMGPLQAAARKLTSALRASRGLRGCCKEPDRTPGAAGQPGPLPRGARLGIQAGAGVMAPEMAVRLARGR